MVPVPFSATETAIQFELMQIEQLRKKKKKEKNNFFITGKENLFYLQTGL